MEANKKEQWITDTLASLEGVRRAEAPADLAEKVAARWREVPSRAWAGTRWNLMPLPTWSMAACAVFLLTINVFTCLQFGRSNRTTPSQSTAFVQEYFDFTPPLSL